jgi:hypothetical protein
MSRLKDGQQISQTDNIKILKEKETHSLTIEKARLEDTGSYSVSVNFCDCEGGCLIKCSTVCFSRCFRGAYCLLIGRILQGCL